MRRVGLSLLVPILLVSAGCGGSGLRMPEARGHSERAALRALGSRGLCSVNEQAADWSAAARARRGTVVDQDPLPGARVEETTLITLWIRAQPNSYDVFTHVVPGCGPVSGVQIQVSSTSR